MTIQKPIVSKKVSGLTLKDRTTLLYISDKDGNSILLDSQDWYYSFNIKKDNKEQPNQGEFLISGLGKNSRSFLDNKAHYVVLYAGYGDVRELLFTGVISETFHQKQGETTVSSIKAQDGANSYRYAYFNKSYKGGTKVKDILQDLSSTLGTSGKDFKDIPENDQFQNGRTLSGSSRKYLREICDYAGLEYSIQNDVLQIHAKGGYNSRECYLISATTGLIGSPQKVKRKKKKSGDTDNTADYKKVKFRVLLNPNLIPSTVVKIESLYINAFYVIREITFSGSASKWNNDTDFIAEVEAEEIIDSEETDELTTKNSPDFIQRIKSK